MLYGAFVVVSVSISKSELFAQIAASSTARAVFDAEMVRIRKQVAEYVVVIDGASSTLSALAKHSDTMSDLEEKDGHSCAEYSRKGVEAALNAGVHPRQLSFKHTVQMWSEFTAQRPGEFIRASGKQVAQFSKPFANSVSYKMLLARNAMSITPPVEPSAPVPNCVAAPVLRLIW